MQLFEIHSFVIKAVNLLLPLLLLVLLYLLEFSVKITFKMVSFVFVNLVRNLTAIDSFFRKRKVANSCSDVERDTLFFILPACVFGYVQGDVVRLEMTLPYDDGMRPESWTFNDVPMQIGVHTQNSYVQGVSLDFTEVFQTVEHDIVQRIIRESNGEMMRYLMNRNNELGRSLEPDLRAVSPNETYGVEANNYGAMTNAIEMETFNSNQTADTAAVSLKALTAATY